MHPQGPRPAAATPAKPLTYRERQRARAEAPKPTYKIRKGKKDITEHPDEPKPKSRRARFYDPDEPFGKKSMVYKLTSQLREQLRDEQQGEGDAFSQKIKPHGDKSEPEPWKRRGRVRPARRSERERRGANQESTWEELTTETRNSRQTSPRSATDEGPKVEKYVPREHPISVPYTTAVSQFLYGKSVVQAALQGGRRKLYKLYIYRGRTVEARKTREGIYKDKEARSQEYAIERLAKAKGVQVVILGDDGLRLMDKMSGNRPHNNFVLETSPLPQLPVISLGALSDSEDKPGYALNLGHQSAEEAAISGSSNFVPVSVTTHKPLVVLLHGVLDPGNLGAILRSAAFLGASAVATTKRGSAQMTPVALKAAAGASETLNLFSVDSVEKFLDDSRANGWSVYAAVPPPADGKYTRPHVDIRGLEETDPLQTKPCILLLGSEGEGLPKQVRKRADFDVHIPNVLGSDMVDSLNVSVAAGLLCHGFLRGRAGEMIAKEKEGSAKFALW